MDYREQKLTLYENCVFYSAVFLIGLLIGWLFYDDLRVGLCTGIILLGIKKEYQNYILQVRRQELLLQFKDFLYSLSSLIASGRSISQGIIESYDFWQGTYSDDDYIMVELKNMENQIIKGNVQAVTALEDFARRSGLKDAEDVAMTCRICKKTGGNLPNAITKCSNIIGDKIALERELKTLMAQKKFEGRIIALAPFLLMLLVKFLSPAYLQPLTESVEGKILSTISLAMIISAWLFIERVNEIEV